MRLPIDVNMMSIATDCDTLEDDDLDKTIQVLLDRRKEIFEKVEKNISTAQQKQKVTSTSCYIAVFCGIFSHF